MRGRFFKIIMVLGAMNFIEMSPPLTSIENAIERAIYIVSAAVMIYLATDKGGIK